MLVPFYAKLTGKDFLWSPDGFARGVLSGGKSWCAIFMFAVGREGEEKGD